MADLSPFDIDLSVRANEHIAVMGRLINSPSSTLSANDLLRHFRGEP
jgi:hypothetical protein